MSDTAAEGTPEVLCAQASGHDGEGGRELSPHPWGQLAQPVPAKRRLKTRVMVFRRGDARFCFRLSEISEVGRTAHVALLDAGHKAFLGTLLLHGVTVPIIDVAVAIGAVGEVADGPPMFVATRERPTVCVAVDEILGNREGEDEDGLHGPHPLVHSHVACHGRSLPVIDGSALAGWVEAMAAV